MELIRSIKCSCGNWEEFPADMPRTESQTFVWVRNIENNKNQADYRCPDCHARVRSKIIEVETHEENRCAWCDKPCDKDFCSEQCASEWVKE